MSEVSLHKLYSDEPEFGDFFSLLKPRVMSLVVFTAIAGLLAAPGNIHPFVAFVSIVFIALGGGASGALNMWYDADIDSICLLYTSPSPRDMRRSRMPSSA